MMIKGVYYIVTKRSDDGTFRKGDIIQRLEDDAISCRQARGWIIPEEVPKATKGMEYEVLS
jgi:hypothetical protein